MRVFFFIYLLLCTACVYAQEFEIDPDQWAPGAIALIRGEKLSGLIYYHKEKQTLYFKQEEQEVRAFKASKVSKFSFYDSTENRERSFISIPFKKAASEKERPEFLEVVRKYKTFFLLSRFSTQKVTIPRNKYIPPQTINQTIEDWYLIDEDGSRHLYFSFIHRDFFNPKVEFFNAALFKEITGPHRNEIEAFSTSKKLNSRKPSDNLKLLDYAEELQNIN